MLQTFPDPRSLKANKVKQQLYPSSLVLILVLLE